MQIALFLGAGFSKWSCDLPLVADLFDFAVRIDSATEERRIVRLKKIYNHWRAKHPLDHPEIFVAAILITLMRSMSDWASL